MAGWDSLETVTRLHGAAQVAGLILLVLVVGLAIFAAFQLRRGTWPEWLDVGQYQLRSQGFVIGFAGVFALLIVVELAAFGYSLRQKILTVAAEQASAERVQRVSTESQKRSTAETELQSRMEKAELDRRRAAENADRILKENAELRQKLSSAETEFKSRMEKAELDRGRAAEHADRTLKENAELRQKLSAAETELQSRVETTGLDRRRAAESADRTLRENAELRQRLNSAETKVAELKRTLQKTQAQRRLSQDQKRLLTDALRPFSGQKIKIASIRNDDDAQVLAQDFVSAFDAAGWDHGGKTGIAIEQWDRDPVGVEITLNETDARAGKISAGVGALINVVRRLGLAYDNTIYMSSEVPAGEALVKVGKKLRK
jgi:hypothetical protein